MQPPGNPVTGWYRFQGAAGDQMPEKCDHTLSRDCWLDQETSWSLGWMVHTPQLPTVWWNAVSVLVVQQTVAHVAGVTALKWGTALLFTSMRYIKNHCLIFGIVTTPALVSWFGISCVTRGVFQNTRSPLLGAFNYPIFQSRRFHRPISF